VRLQEIITRSKAMNQMNKHNNEEAIFDVFTARLGKDQAKEDKSVFSTTSTACDI